MSRIFPSVGANLVFAPTRPYRDGVAVLGRIPTPALPLYLTPCPNVDEAKAIRTHRSIKTFWYLPNSILPIPGLRHLPPHHITCNFTTPSTLRQIVVTVTLTNKGYSAGCLTH